MFILNPNSYESVLLLQAYAVTAIMKIYAFEMSAGRKVDMLPEVHFINTYISSLFTFSKHR